MKCYGVDMMIMKKTFCLMFNTEDILREGLKNKHCEGSCELLS